MRRPADNAERVEETLKKGAMGQSHTDASNVCIALYRIIPSRWALLKVFLDQNIFGRFISPRACVMWLRLAEGGGDHCETNTGQENNAGER